jgi:hypothetical protein
LGLHHHGHGLLGRLDRLVILLEFFDDFLRGRLHLLDHAAPARPADLGDLALEVVPIARDLFPKAGGLERERPGEGAQDRERQDHDENDRRGAG